MRLAALVLLFAGSPPPQASDACFDRLLLTWNQFADHANRYMHTVEVNRERRDRDRERLRKEWEAVNRCECF